MTLINPQGRQILKILEAVIRTISSAVDDEQKESKPKKKKGAKNGKRKNT